jgi:predicted DNA binding CopG/RHH family protein
METVKIGRTEVNKDAFIKAVADARSLPDICKAFGLNYKVVSTKQNIRNLIHELGLPTEHLVYYGWKPSEEWLQNKVKTFHISEDNQIYIDEFLCSLPERNVSTYKSSCGNFMEELGEQDFAEVTSKQILDFANTKKTQSMVNNVTAHLRSMMIYLVSNDVNKAKEKVSKDMLIWLITK